MNPRKLTTPTYSFSAQDLTKANDEWGCNCGPSALAAITGVSLDDVRPVIPEFEKRKYTSHAMMKAALATMGVPWKDVTKDNPEPLLHTPAEYGLCRIQWEGPWYGRFAYFRTHWIASMESKELVYVFDCNGGWRLFNGLGN
jgi:hypothetical protein